MKLLLSGGLVLLLLWMVPATAESLGDYTTTRNLFKAGQYENVIHILSKETTEAPAETSEISTIEAKNTDATRDFWLGLSYWKQGRRGEGEPHLQAAAHDENFILADLATLLLAEGRYQQKNFSGAAGTYKFFEKKYPDSSFAFRAKLGRAKIARHLGRTSDALALLKEAATDSETPFVGAPAQWELANIYTSQKRYVDAYYAFKKIAREYPDFVYAIAASRKVSRLGRRGDVQASLQKMARAERMTSGGASSSGPVVGARTYAAAKALARRGKYEAAIDRLQALIYKYPDSPYATAAHFYSGIYSELLGDTSSAKMHYNKLIDHHATSQYVQDAIFQLGFSQYREWNYATAGKTFERARAEFSLQNDSDRNIFWEAKAWKRAGLEEHSASLLQFLTEKYPYSYYGYRARDELKKQGIETTLDVGSQNGHFDGVAAEDSGSEKEQIHRERLTLLREWGLLESAAAEANHWVQTHKGEEKLAAQIELYDILAETGHIRDGIRFADRMLDEAISKADTPPDILTKLWRISYPKGFWDEVTQAARQWDVDPLLVLAVIREESRFNKRAVSRARAMGLMQIIPPTGKKIAVQLNLRRYHTEQLFDPKLNVTMGTYYLAGLLSSYGDAAYALAAYNGGPARVSRWRKEWGGSEIDIDEFVERIPIRETRTYVKKVLHSYFRYQKTYGSDGQSWVMRKN